MVSTKVILFQALYLTMMVHSQIPVNLPSPAMLPGPQMLPPNIVAVGTLTGGGPSDTPDTEPSSIAPPVAPSSIGSAPSPPQAPPPNNASSSLPVPPVNITWTTPPLNTSFPSSRFNGSVERPPSPPLPISAVTTQRSMNATGGVSVEVDDFETNGTIPNITLVVSSVGNGTKISIKNNSKA
uniref:Uncharacterized protein n=1 Tax=Graphocephala atropunctata TaxID=36148 RepID=A0A1B6MD16_9HEMI